MNIELKPCPFCGGEATVSSYTYSTLGGGYVQFKVECERHDCPAQPTVDWHYWSEAEAAEAWNTRAERTCRIERRESMWGGYTEHCSECGADLGCDTRNRQHYCPNCGAKVVDA